MCKSQESFKWALQPLHGPLSYRPRNFGHRESSAPLQETHGVELVRGIASETERLQLPRGVGPSNQAAGGLLCVLFQPNKVASPSFRLASQLRPIPRLSRGSPSQSRAWHLNGQDAQTLRLFPPGTPLPLPGFVPGHVQTERSYRPFFTFRFLSFSLFAGKRLICSPA